MEQLKQILQLKNDGVAIREIARRTGISRNSIKKYLSRLEQPLSAVAIDLSNQQLAEAAYDPDTLEKKPYIHLFRQLRGGSIPVL